jgi:peptidoglycan hydrolase-like protein with peptidoglycan-binding domain
MANDGMPTVSRGNTGDAVRQAQRAMRRMPDITLEADGIFGSMTETAAKRVQQAHGLPATGVVDEHTWKVLPDGNPMPTLQQGSTGEAVRCLQEILTMGASGLWELTPKGVDGDFGSNTAASVRAFQAWAGIKVDGIVGAETWRVRPALEFVTGLQHVTASGPNA